MRRKKTKSLDTLIRVLPKAELHVHLEGTMTPEFAHTLARRYQHPLAEGGPKAIEALYRHRDFEDFLDHFKVPVLASNCSSLPEIVVDPSARFDPNDPEEIAEKLNWVLQDDGARSQLAQAGLTRSKQFSWQQAARETFQLYEEVTGSLGE